MKYKFAVSGATITKHCQADTMNKAKDVGREIVKHDSVLITGATTGVPLWAAIGAKEAGGFNIGMSPATSELEHVKKYHLPTEYFDIIVYTGFGYSGRNLLMTRSTDAIIIICGRMGTLNEFTIAFEDDKPIGVLTGSGGIADEIAEIVEKAHRGDKKIIYESDPKLVVEKLIQLVEKEKEQSEPPSPYSENYS